jgi:hypothetical protein
MAHFRTEQKSGQDEPPPKDDGSILKSLLHRVDPRTGKFVRLSPDDRQLYFPFIRKIS